MVPLSGFFILILAGGFFAAAETAVTYSNKFRMKVKSDDGDKKAALVLKMAEDMDNSLIVILVGNNVIHVCASVLASLMAVSLLKSEALGTVVATVVTTVLVFVFNETIPKNIAQANADSMALAFAYPLKFLSVLLTPVSIIFKGLIWLVRKVSGHRGSEEEPSITEDDFTDIIESVEKEGVLDEQESDIIQAAVQFNDKQVKDVFTPTEKFVSVNVNATRQKILEQITRSGFSRYPVYEGSADNIIGVLHVRSYHKMAEHNKGLRLREALIPPYKVPENTTMDEVFEGFRAHRTHIAFVVDSEGRTTGLVTMEDVLEELVEGIAEKMPETAAGEKV